VDALESAVNTVESNLPIFDQKINKEGNQALNKISSPTRCSSRNQNQSTAIIKDNNSRSKKQATIANINAHLFNEK
jgi:hypothetical protein